MGFYARWLLPPLLDLAMRHRRLACYRRRAIAAARGSVLEIGVGSGLNLPLYGAAVRRIVGVDPAAELLARAQAKAATVRPPVVLVRGSAEALPIAAAVIDTVVTTWTLCSVADAPRALREMRRVLAPGGRLIFVEHGLAPEAGVAAWQRRLTPYWRRIAGGCHLDRPMDALIREAGFAIAELRTGYMAGPRPMTFMYEGSAAPEC